MSTVPALPTPPHTPDLTSTAATYLGPPWANLDWRAVLLYDAAVRSGLTAALPATAAAAAETCGADAGTVRIVLDALGALGLVTVDAQQCFHRRVEPDAETAATLTQHARAIRRWSEGLPVALGVTEEDPTRPQPGQTLPALAGRARAHAAWLADTVRARTTTPRRMLDLGGGHGEHARAFAARGLDTVLQDTPETVAWLAETGRLDDAGVGLHAGDFLVDLAPGPFDVVLLAGIVHIYAGEAIAELLTRVAECMPSGGVIAVSTMLRRRNTIAPLFAVQMTLGGQQGDTHGEGELIGWLEAAGFTAVELTDVPDRPQTLLTAVKRGEVRTREG